VTDRSTSGISCREEYPGLGYLWQYPGDWEGEVVLIQGFMLQAEAGDKTIRTSSVLRGAIRRGIPIPGNSRQRSSFPGFAGGTESIFHPEKYKNFKY